MGIIVSLTTLAETLASNHPVEGFLEAGAQFGKSFHYKEPSGKVFSLTSDVVKWSTKVTKNAKETSNRKSIFHYFSASVVLPQIMTT